MGQVIKYTTKQIVEQAVGSSEIAGKAVDTFREILKKEIYHMLFQCPSHEQMYHGNQCPDCEDAMANNSVLNEVLRTKAMTD